MKANEIVKELELRKARSAWDKGVTEYATELAKSLDNWDKQPESVGGGAAPVDINKLNLNQKGMNNYGIFKKWDWCYIKFDGRKKIFRGMTKAEFAAAKDKHFAHQRARYGSAPEGRCKSLETVDFLKKYVNTNYEKIIIEGNVHLYIASPIYRHGDYNKCIFSENTPKNRRKAELINKLLEKARNNSVNG